MDNNEQNQTNKDEQHQGKTAKDEIPLWLQGLDESTDEEGKNKELKSDGENIQPEVEWVKEIARETMPEEQEKAISEPKEPISHLPSEEQDVIVYQPVSDETAESINSNQSFDEDKTKAVQTEETPTAKSEEFEQPPEGEEFIEISDIEIPQNQEQIDDLKEEMIPDDEELPDWLHEMIAEGPKDILEETIPSVIEKKDEEKEEEEKDEPTEPIDITQETPIEIEESYAEEQDAFIEQRELSSEEHERIFDQSEPYLEEQKRIIDQPDASIEKEEILVEQMEPSVEPALGSLPPEDFPVQTEVDTSSIPFPTEVPISKQHEMPKTLRFAKFLLDQGDYKQALDIIHTYMDKPEYTEKIKEWLNDAVHDGAGLNSDVWESLGDIALRYGDPEGAFVAYTKAINILLGLTKGSHETH